MSRFRRRLVLSALPAAGAALGACAGASTPAAPAALEGPREISWMGYTSTPDRQGLFEESFKKSGEVNGVKVTVTWEGSADYWTKRQAEFAGGSTSADVMVLNLDWVLPGGFSGMFVDHNEYMKRDKVDPKQYYKAALDTWAWKGKQWAIPLQAGGEMVLYNKKLFDERGVKYPTKDWTYDDLLDMCQRLNDPGQNKFAIEIGQNGLHYMMGTFVYNFGGKLLNDAKDRALYGDDARVHPGRRAGRRPAPALPLHPHPRGAGHPAPGGGGVRRRDGGHGDQRLLPAHHGPDGDRGREPGLRPAAQGAGGQQTASRRGQRVVAMANLSKAKEAAWRCLKWLHTKEGMLTPQLKAVSWPPLIWAGSAPEWLEIFKGTKINDVARVWETGGHDFLVLPEGSEAWTAANTPMSMALRGEIATRQAMQESARALNELFSQRPADWK